MIRLKQIILLLTLLLLLTSAHAAADLRIISYYAPDSAYVNSPYSAYVQVLNVGDEQANITSQDLVNLSGDTPSPNNPLSVGINETARYAFTTPPQPCSAYGTNYSYYFNITYNDGTSVSEVGPDYANFTFNVTNPLIIQNVTDSNGIAMQSNQVGTLSFTVRNYGSASEKYNFTVDSGTFFTLYSTPLGDYQAADFKNLNFTIAPLTSQSYKLTIVPSLPGETELTLSVNSSECQQVSDGFSKSLYSYTSVSPLVNAVPGLTPEQAIPLITLSSIALLIMITRTNS